MREGTSFGDPIPADCAVIEVRVTEPAQMLNAIDPSPFRERDLAPSVEEFIVSRSKDLPRAASLGLVIHLDRSIPDHEAVVLRNAIQRHFGERAGAARRRLRELFRSACGHARAHPARRCGIDRMIGVAAAGLDERAVQSRQRARSWHGDITAPRVLQRCAGV